MPMLVPAAMVAGSVASSAIGSAAAQSQTDAANAARQQAIQQWISVNVPDPKQQQIELENYQVTGKLSPELETAFQQSQSGLSGISLDPASRDAEMAALSKMQDLAQNGGLDAQSQQQLTQAINQTNANEKGQRDAIVQNAAARGMGQGGGAMLAAELQASQGDANQAAAGGQSAAAAAEMRALQALQGSASIGATLNSQDYQQKAAAAEAQDAINRFNTQNAQSVSNANVTNSNAAQAANLANAQSVANANTGVANQEEISNKGLIQQQFQNQATKAAGASGQYAGAAAQDNQNAQNTANMWSGIGQSLAKGVGAYGQYSNSKPNTPADTTQNTGPTGDTFPATENYGDAPMAHAEGGIIEKKPSHFEQLLAMIKQAKGAPHAA